MPKRMSMVFVKNGTINRDPKENKIMIDSRMLREIQGAPVEERLHLIEIILQSLKKDIETTPPALKKMFTVRKFSLGAEVHADRQSTATTV